MPLSDCFLDLFVFVSRFAGKAAAKRPPFDQVKGSVLGLLARSEERAQSGQVPAGEYQQARFAVCAWVDEMLVGSTWEHRELWLRDQLQRAFFNTTRAGEEFFERLASLGPQEREVREVYYLCLALGFSGRFCKQGDEHQLEKLRSDNLRLLVGDAAVNLEQAHLFTEDGCPSGGMPAPPRRSRTISLPAALCLCGPPMVFGVLFLIYRFTLSGIGRHFLSTVAN